MHYLFKILIIGGLLIFSCFNLKAQVTIGSEVKPVAGALLDLKEQEKADGSKNSNKGLGLPRVGLLHLTIPENKTSLATTIDKASGEWDADEHIGLVVYNVNKGGNGAGPVCPVDFNSAPNEGLKQGPYVWDGKEWLYLGITEDNTTEGDGSIEYVTDGRDGNKYPYRAFGDPDDPANFAGYWTLENARYIDESMTYGESNDRKDRTYLYPNGDYKETPPATWRPNQGLLYSYSAATLGGQDDYWELGNGYPPGQGQESGDVENTPIMQGVCPQGWHVPTDREWNTLARVIYNNPTEYSKYTSAFATPWDENQEIEETIQGIDGNQGLGIALLSACTPIFINDNGDVDRDVSVGKSKTSLDGGFNALLVGAVNPNEPGSLNSYYKLATSFFTSSLLGGSNEGVWGRVISLESPEGLARSTGDMRIMSSVRCKKD